MKRQRGRGRKPGGHNQPNRTLESTGPDGKVRGPAAQIYEKYQQLSRDAASYGDRVMVENFLQHAEHYYRVMRAMAPAQAPQNFSERHYQDNGYEGADEGGPEHEAGGHDDGAGAGEEGQPEAEFQAPAQDQDADRDGGFRRRRGRRQRFRSNESEAEAGAAPPEAGQERPRRPQRERGDEPRREDSVEGFSSGPRPAFLGSE